MKTSRNLALLLSLFAMILQVNAQTRLTSKDLESMIGNWKGTLTYKDYSSGKETAIRSNLSISSPKPNNFSFAATYPDEPKANSTDMVVLSADGRMLDGERVLNVMRLTDGLKIVTESRGPDGNDNKMASFRHTYQWFDDSFMIKKEVRFDGTKEWILRNESNYLRN